MNYWVNVALLFIAPVPSALYAWLLKSGCTPGQHALHIDVSIAGAIGTFGDHDWHDWACAVGYQHPFLTANLLFFFNVCVGFWLASVVQKSTWLIDPYWTILPVLLAHFYQAHPAATYSTARSGVSLLLLWTWSLRLTYSYLRREKWQLGEREDWRYADMRKKWGPHWLWASFLLVYIIQQAMLVGISAPFYPIHSSAAPWHPLWDTLATACCSAGLLISGFADQQLHDFMQHNERLVSQGQQPVLILNTGLWRYSRHPNYFGEQLWWWGLALFAVHLDHPWAVLGTLFNSACLVGVTQLTEARMLAKPERAELFREYQQTTSVWVPWFKTQSKRRRD